MPELTVVDATSPVELGVAEEVIAGLKGRLTGLTADTHQGYVMVKSAISEVTKYRTGVEKARKELKKSALDWGKKVDAEARRVTALLLEIETPLREEKALIDDEAERRRKQKEEAERLAIEAKERAEREACEAVEKAQRELEEEERKAQAARLAQERKALEAERKQLEDERRKQQEALEAERLKIVADREEIEKVKRAVEEEARKEREAALAAEREAQEKEERAKEAEAEEARLTEEAAEAERLAEYRKPDRQKLVEFVFRLDAVEHPTMATQWGIDALTDMLERLDNAFSLRD